MSRLVVLALAILALRVPAARADIFQDAAAGNVAAVSRALDDDPNVLNALDPRHGGTPLHWAAYGGREAVVELLLAKGARVDCRNKNGMTPLHNAAGMGHVAVIRHLLEAGADVALQDNTWHTPRDYALQQRWGPAANLLAAAEAEVIRQLQGETPPAGAVWMEKQQIGAMSSGAGMPSVAGASTERRRIQLAGLSFPHGVGTHAPSRFPMAFDGEATRFVAVVGVDDEVGARGSVEFQVWLDGKPAATSGLMRGGRRPRLLSVDTTGAHDVDFIITDGGDGDSRDHADWAGAVIYPIPGEGPATVAAPEPGIDACDADGTTALHHAVADNQIAVAKVLLEHKANANARRRNGVTPLHIAASMDRPEIARLLLAAGADRNARDAQGRTPRWLALSNHHPEVLTLLTLPGDGPPEAPPPAPPEDASPSQPGAPLAPPPRVPPTGGHLPAPLSPPPVPLAADQLLLEGVAVSLQTNPGRLWLRVHSITAPSGARREIADPSCGTVLVGASGSGQTPGRGQEKPCDLTGLKPGAWVRVVVAAAPGAGSEGLLALRSIARIAPEGAAAETSLLAGKAPAHLLPLDSDGVSHAVVAVPMAFPVAGRSSWCDTFLAPRGGGKRRHHGQDVMAQKMMPLVAVFDGTVEKRSGHPTAGNTLHLRGDNGYEALYMHMNNDTPGTDDGKGTGEYCFAAGLENGSRVVAGQLVGWVGDSGNAESTPPHVHFEVHYRGKDAVLNPAASLRTAQRVAEPRVVAAAVLLKPGPGEVRVEGFVRQVEAASGELVLDVAYRTDWRGKTRAVTKPERRRIHYRGSAALAVLGAEQVKLPLANVARGTRVALVGKEAGTVLTPSRSCVLMDGFVPDPALALQLAAVTANRPSETASLGPGALGGAASVR